MVAVASSPQMPAGMMRLKILNVVSVTVLFLVFGFSYKELIVPTYDYYGMSWRDPPAYMLASSLLMNMIIAFLANPVYRRPSQLFLAIQFLVVFLPASIVCLNVSLPEIAQQRAFEMIVFMFLGLLFQTLFSQKGASRVRRRVAPVNQAKLIKAFLCFAVFVLAGAIYALGSLFTLTDFSSMYEQRELLDEQSMNAVLRYGISWLVYLILPTLLVAGYSLRGYRRIVLIAFCMAAYFALFGITATKTTMFAPVIIGLIYLALARTSVSYISKFGLGFAALLGIPILTSLMPSLDLFSLLYVSIVNFRIFAVPQALYVQYLDFFSTHANTWGSHVNLVSWFVTYPFDSPVFLLVGDYYYPGSNQTANAGAWAQDGIAGFGLIGIPLISILLSMVMRALDFAADGYDPQRVGGSLAMLALLISNVSFFTALLSGGLGIAIILMYLAKRVSGRRPTSHRSGLGRRATGAYAGNVNAGLS